MNIYLGNLNLKDIVKTESIDKIQTFLDSNGYKHEFDCEAVENKKGNYHIYDIPRVWAICGEEKANQLVNFLKKENLVEEFIGTVGVSVIESTKQPNGEGEIK